MGQPRRGRHVRIRKKRRRALRRLGRQRPPGRASLDWKAPRPLPWFVRSRGRAAAALAAPTKDGGSTPSRLRTRDAGCPWPNPSGLRAAMHALGPSVRLQSGGLGRRSGPLAPRKGRPPTRATAGGQGHASPGGCARVSRRLQKSTSGVRRSILDAVAAVLGKQRLARTRIAPQAGERHRAPRSNVRGGRSRALVVGGRYSSSVSPLVAGHAVSLGGRRGALAAGLCRKAGQLRETQERQRHA